MVGHDPPDDVGEFDGGGSDGGEVVQAGGALAEEVVPQVAFEVDGAVGHEPQGASEAGRAAFADASSPRRALAAFVDGGVEHDTATGTSA